MSLFQRFWDYLFGADERRGPETSAEAAADAPIVATRDADEDETDYGHEKQPQAWWIPRPPPDWTQPDPEETPEMHNRMFRALGAIVDDPNVDLPRLPHVTDRALVMLRGDEASYRELARLIGEDPALTAQVLRVANSVMYGGATEIRTLEAAFARLGQRTLRALILSASLRSLSIRLGGSKRTLGEGIWRRALASGVIAERMGRRCGMNEADAFLMGLLHDIGLYVVLTITHKYTQDTGRKVPRAVFDRLATEWHEHAGLRLARTWNLPEPLPDIVARHHKMPSEDDPLRKERLLVMFTDVCCSLLGYAPYHPYDFFQTPCVRLLGLTDCPQDRDFLATLPQEIESRIELS